MERRDDECIFCRIIAGALPSERVFETEQIVAFRDIAPAAPTHILIVPREHIASISDLRDEDVTLAGELLLAARTIAAQEGLPERGYRIASNMGEWGDQSVRHLHIHLLGGRQLGRLG